MTLLTPRRWRRGETTLDRIPDGRAKDRGVTAGQAEARSGIHTRTADEAGVRLGRDVAAHTIRNAARLFAR